MVVYFQVNTERAEFLSQGMNHIEGGWPKDINPTENDQTMRFRKKIEKDDSYVGTVLGLCQVGAATQRNTPQVESRVYACPRQNLPNFQHYPIFNTSKIQVHSEVF